MNPAELELFLYRHTESENWHLQHPGQLSHIYDKMKQEEFRGEVGYCVQHSRPIIVVCAYAFS